MKGCLVMGSPYRSVDIFKALEEAQVERVNSIELLNEFHKVGKHVLGKKLPIAGVVVRKSIGYFFDESTVKYSHYRTLSDEERENETILTLAEGEKPYDVLTIDDGLGEIEVIVKDSTQVNGDVRVGDVVQATVRYLADAWDVKERKAKEEYLSFPTLRENVDLDRHPYNPLRDVYAAISIDKLPIDLPEPV